MNNAVRNTNEVNTINKATELDIEYFAKLSRIAYKSEKRIYEELAKLGFDYEHIKVIVVSGCQCFIARKRHKVFIAFRGSDNLRNWLNNFNYRKSNDVHGGFWNSAKKLYDKVINYIDVNDELYVTGHSLGASLSLLVSNMIYEDLKYVKSVVVFESPNIAGEDYIKATSGYKFKRVHIRNNVDIVTHIPPTSMGFKNYDFDIVVYFNWVDKAKINPTSLYIIIDKARTLIGTKRWKEVAEDHLLDNVMELIVKNSSRLKDVDVV